MKIKNLSIEEIEAMSYDDLAYLILLESKKKMKITDLFKKVCDLMNLDEKTYETKIEDFFELLSTDRKFIMLENGFWDLRERHTQKIIIENDDEDSLGDSIEEDLEDLDLDEDEEEDIYYEPDENEDDVDNDLKDLVIIEDEEDETNGLI